MKKIFEAHANQKTVDFDSETEAKSFVEAAGEGYVVTFVRGFDNRDRSSGMESFAGTTWRGINIHE